MGDVRVFMTRDVGVQNAQMSDAVLSKAKLDPVVDKKLKFAVKAVSPGVASVRKSFEAVKKALSDLKYSNNAPFVVEWREIVEDYERVLDYSGELALQGAEQIEVFLSTIMPYLLEEKEDIGAKQEEVENYRKALKEGGREARNFSVSLDSISERVDDFKKKWGGHTNEFVSLIRTNIEQLEKDLVSLADSMQEVKTGIASIRARGQAESSGESLKAVIKHAKSEMKREIKEARRELERQTKSDKIVVKKADSIKLQTDSLTAVWNLITDDINVIESQLRTGVRGRSPALFRVRVAVLKWQYSGLGESLRNYATAVSFESTDNSGRSFVTRFMSLLASNK